MGIVKIKSLARSYVWWPCLNKNIEETCKSCTVCQSVQRIPNKGVLQSWPIPINDVWERIYIDFLGPIQVNIV